MGGRGVTNPALFCYITDLFPYFYINMLGKDVALNIEIAAFILLISLMSLVTFRSIKKLNAENNILNRDKEFIIVFLLFILFSFLMPRFKDYDYILLILPAFYIINKDGFINSKYLLVFIFVIASAKVTLPGFKIFFKLFWSYYALFQAIIAWMLYILYINKFSKVTESKTLNDELRR